jgi:hydroxyacylglutathione hydrolase
MMVLLLFYWILKGNFKLNLTSIVGGSIGTNCYAIEENNKIILFDFVPEVELFLKNKNYSIDKIFLTHIHFDHVELLFDFQKRHNFELILSDFAYKNINNTSYNLLEMLPDVHISQICDIDLNNAKIVKDDDEIIWENNKIIALESPGHSKDSMVYIFPEKEIAITGDLIFYKSVGRTDFKGSSYNDLMNSIKKLFNKIGDDFILYPGHGPKTTVKNEKQNNPFLR